MNIYDYIHKHVCKIIKIVIFFKQFFSENVDYLHKTDFETLVYYR